MQIKERDIERQILRYLNKIGFAIKIPDQRRIIDSFSPRGIPDIMLVVGGQTILFEVKTDKGRLSPHQVVFHAKYKQFGGQVFTVRSVEDVKGVLSDFTFWT